ncbi:MAG: ATP/GTP-binding protein, partial [Saprospiraceae bacterium]
MIINFSVTNFGSIKEQQTLSFEADSSKHLEDFYIIESNGLRLLKLGLIYGANASGKTTLLKALDFLNDLVRNPEEKKIDELGFEPFLFDPDTPKENSILSIEFLQQNTRYFYEVEFSKKAIVREELNFYQPNKANVFKRDTNLKDQLTTITFGSKIKKNKTAGKVLEANTLWNNTVLGGFLKTNIDLPELKGATDWFDSYLAPLIYTQSDLRAFIVDQIHEAAISKIDVLSILKRADFNVSDILIKREEVAFPEAFLDVLEQNKINEQKLNAI